MIGTADRTHDILLRVADFLKKLPEDQLEALANGEAKLELVPKGGRAAKAANVPVVLTFDVDRVNSDLKALGDRDAATRYLKDLKLKKPQAAELAKQLDIAVTSKDTLAVILAKIVEQKVGRQLISDAIFARKQ